MSANTETLPLQLQVTLQLKIIRHLSESQKTRTRLFYMPLCVLSIFYVFKFVHFDKQKKNEAGFTLNFHPLDVCILQKFATGFCSEPGESKPNLANLNLMKYFVITLLSMSESY